nr:MAG TPA: hypothetical protein [Caudoviricetes sp.]
MADTPITREEKYLAYLTGDYKADIPKPITRQERYLYELCLKSMGGEISPEEIQKAVNDYLDKNPVKPGATTEQAQQIEQNKTDIASLKTETSSLKEDMASKITKFYASNQGNTNLPDSDNGKITDMMLYGKSEQKQYSGKNLLNATLQTTTQNGITCTNNGDGTFTLNGTATANCILIVIRTTALKNAFGENEELKLTGSPKVSSTTGYYLQMWKNEPDVVYRDTGGGVTVKKPNADCNVAIVIAKGTVCNNLLFKPMLTTDPTATYDDFEPYTGGIPSPNPDYPQEIKSVVNPTVKVCGKNLLKATLESTTKKGIICTSNGDGTYTLNGTANGGGDTTVSFNVGYMIAKSGKYMVVGCPNGGSTEKYNLRVGKDTLPWGTYMNSDLGNGCVIDVTENTPISLNLMIKDGYTCNNVLFKPMLTTDLTATYDDFEPYHEQTVTLPYDLYGIKVTSGGNVAINGQQYASDYFDAERGKIVRMVKKYVFTGDEDINKSSIVVEGFSSYYLSQNIILDISEDSPKLCSHFASKSHMSWINLAQEEFVQNPTGGDKTNLGFRIKTERLEEDTVDGFRKFLKNNKIILIYKLNTPIEIDLTTEEIAAFKALATYYPTTNISVNSDELDGYTVFNYPISMANGWNYVKQQIGDTRDYIYDMDARTQDTDLQAAEAYVNSEYAVALTELEV